jgi:uncharacterized protein (UPF0332 family)
MTLSADDLASIVYYRRQRAHATLQEADEMIASSHWNLAIQRMYYAVFYMASALLLQNRITAHTHSGVFNQISVNFVTTGKLGKEEGKFYARLLQDRIKGDYNDLFDFNEKYAKKCIDPTKALVARLEELIITL